LIQLEAKSDKKPQFSSVNEGFKEELDQIMSFQNSRHKKKLIRFWQISFQ
jgi:hypothetical protein